MAHQFKGLERAVPRVERFAPHGAPPEERMIDG